MGEELETRVGEEAGNEVVDEPMDDVDGPSPAGGDDPPYASGSASDSDTDSESDSEAQDKIQVNALESQLYSNPYDYDAHVQYIRHLRKAADINKLRQAREAMSALFPFTPAMWQEWVRDEASFVTGLDGYLVIEKLYERGVSDYLSIPLWYDYLNFVQDNEPSVRECSLAGVTKVRSLFERALTAAGLHVSKGNKIWEAYREFEQAIYYHIDESDTTAKEKQVQRIRNLFHRQLSVPLVGMENTIRVYEAWEAQLRNAQDVESCDINQCFPHVASAYQKALGMYNDRAHFEEQISNKDLSDTEKLQQYLMYLKFENSSGDPARVQVLYERAVADFPISTDLWLAYTGYMDKTLKAGDVVKNVHLRATKNCPWLGELWVRYLLCLEHGHASETDISSVFEKSLRCTFSTLEEYLDLFLTRVDGLRRRLSSVGESEAPPDYLSIKETFQRAADYLAPQLKNTDALLHLYAYWARMESRLGKDMAAARGVWESLLKISGSMLEAWQGYISMEVELGHITEARSIYKRCYSKRFPGAGSQEICHSWLRFEREFGTLEDFDHAVQKVKPRLEELSLFMSQQDSRTIDQQDNSIKRNVREKRKSGADIAAEVSPAKRPKDVAHMTKKTYLDDKGNASESENNGEDKAKAGVGTNLQEIKDLTPDAKSKAYTDECTAFISNLDLKATNDHIREFFSDIGGVTAVRILRDKFTGKSRGLAYVDFVDDVHLTSAVAKNKKILLGKKLSIARSNPKKSRKESLDHVVHVENADSRSASSKVVESSRKSKEVPHKSRSSTTKERGEQVQLRGKNTFAIPRNVRPLGWDADKPRSTEKADETPKSNDEFREILLKR